MVNATLDELLRGSPYAGYTYSYPHKTAYRTFEPPVPLTESWEHEVKDALFLYLHVPFCEMRCGFCNLFTTNRPGGREDQYLVRLREQALRVGEALGEAQFSRLAIGGGTPTFLSPANLDALFGIVRDVFATDPAGIPVSVETSPQTATADRLSVLRDQGVSRVSIGIQSFLETEAHAAGRPQKTKTVLETLERIRNFGFPILNLDLIYGLPGQSVATWLESLQTALTFSPEEIYLYPLYVRPLTGLERRTQNHPSGEDIRAACYAAGRDLLLGSGYVQVSMRKFQKTGLPVSGPTYCCQEDGMVGLGSGARSYTSDLHYSGEYAVGAQGVNQIIDAYLDQPLESFNFAHYGFHLDADEQRRRYIIQSVLQAEGLSFRAYANRFGTSALDDMPQLRELESHGLAEITAAFLRPTARGLQWSDAIGPWLGSAMVQQQMEAYVLR